MDLKTLRLQAGLTQEEAAKLVYRTRETWAAYESGRSDPDPTVRELFETKTAALRDILTVERGKLGLK